MTGPPSSTDRKATAGLVCGEVGAASMARYAAGELSLNDFGVGLAVLFLGLGLLLLYRNRSRVLLVDFMCYTPSEKNKRDRDWSLETAAKCGVFSQESLDFMERVYKSSGVGPLTYFPDSVLKMLEKAGHFTEDELHHGVPHPGRLEEADAAAFQTIHELLKKTGIKASEIGVVITACDCFFSQPSMSSRIVNHFKMRTDILSYSMTGMGCSNGGVAIDMAKHLLKANPETLVLIFNHENVSAGGYIGNDHSMLLPYCLFRVSGAAAILSNRKRDLKTAKYELTACVRTHTGFDDRGYNAIRDGVDDKGLPGIRLNKDVVPAATKALKINLIRMGPKILPIMEMVKVVFKKGYRPDFKKATEHFIIHTGGKAVLDSVEKAFDLPPEKMQPSRDSLYRFANTAGASPWYTLLALESRTGVKQGDRVLTLMVGAGFKAVTAMWKARKSIHEVHPLWALTTPNCEDQMK